MRALKITTFFILSLISYSAMADFLLSQNGDFLHEVNFTIPNQKLMVMDVKASFGYSNGNSCQYTKLVNIGEIYLEGKNNSRVTYGIDNKNLKKYAGSGYTCGKFTFNQSKEDEFKLVWNGENYIAA